MSPDRGRNGLSRARTARIVVPSYRAADIGAAFRDCELSWQLGEIHITAHLHDYMDVHSLLDRLRSLGVTLISLSVDRAG
jgi:hypothetical protein